MSNTCAAGRPLSASRVCCNRRSRRPANAARSAGEHLVEAALHLLLGEGLDELRDDPHVAEGVLDASGSVSVELVANGNEHLGARSLRRLPPSRPRSRRRARGGTGVPPSECGSAVPKSGLCSASMTVAAPIRNSVWTMLPSGAVSRGPVSTAPNARA